MVRYAPLEAHVLIESDATHIRPLWQAAPTRSAFRMDPQTGRVSGWERFGDTKIAIAAV